jgi:signal transduction histidine kinase/ligand-binding sensor domain-containing protein
LRRVEAATNRAKSRVTRALFLLSIFCFCSSSVMTALDPARRISQYGHTAWRVQDGYFPGAPFAIAQTADGYIWVGTAAGLFRFDGVRLVPWSALSGEQLPSTDIYYLLGVRDGSLWIATYGGLAHWTNHHLITYQKGEGWVIGYIVEDRDGKIWFTRARVDDYSHPLCQVNDLAVHCYGSDDGVPASNASALVQDPRGDFWLGSSTALLRWRPGSSKEYRPRALRSSAGTNGVSSLALAPDSSLMVGIHVRGPGGGLQHMVDGVLRPFVAPRFNSETIAATAILTDRQNNLWVGTENQGVYRIHGADVDHFGSADGLSSDGVSFFFQDREGNLWVATTKGIDMFRDLRVSTFSTREGLSDDGVDSVLARPDGALWVGSAYLDLLGPHGVSVEPGRALRGHQVTSLLQDHAGHLWAGMDDTLSIYEGGKFRQIKRPDGSALGMIMGMTEDSEHNIWVETHGPPATLIRIQDLKIREEFPAPPLPLARKLAPDPQSGIWLGLVNGDLARFRSGKTEIFSFPSHPNTRVKGLFATSDGSILGATEFGVVGWRNGKQRILTVRNGLPCDWVNSLIFDKEEDLWLYAECGLIEIQKEELQRWWEQPDSRLNPKLFGLSDGVQPGWGHFNTSARTPDGRLWFANASVLQMVDPSNMAGNTIPPPVDINDIVADRKSYPLQESPRLPPLTRDLEIDYTALSFMAPQKVIFRYMLEGHDAGWQEPGTRRQAFYNDLGPGHYRFHVIACNNDGVWNEAGALLDFSILPAYYQTAWFRASCGAAFLLLLWFIYQFRLRQLQHQFNIGLEARVNERTRIARDLHDTLLQTFHGLMFQFQAVRNLMSRNPDAAMRSLDDAINETEKALTESRDAIKGLRSEPIAKGDLAELLRATSQEPATSGTANQDLANQNPPVFDLVEEGERRTLSPATKNEICRIAVEVLRNAFNHARAHRIEVEIRYDSHALRLRIRDDGRGIDPKVLKEGGSAGHWGLRGVRERAERIGAKLDFWSDAGAGTEVQVSVPAAVAYEASRESIGSKLSRKVINRGQRS